MNRYIHYGSDKFDINKFLPIVNQDHDWTKPKQGGIWASPIDAEYGWKQFCEDEKYKLEKLKTHFVFDITEDAKVCHIKSFKDIWELPHLDLNDYMIPTFYMINFEKSMEKYDAIELHLSENNLIYDALYGWDCDSILIMNPDIIKQEDKNDRNKI